MTNTYDVLLSHPDDPSVLLIPGEEGWSLPRFELKERGDSYRVIGLTRLFGERWGIECTVLRCLHQQWRPETETVKAAYVLEIYGPEMPPESAGRWARLEELDVLPFAEPEQREWIRTWLSEVETGNFPPLRSPWAIPGWYAEAVGWIEGELREIGVEGPVTVEKDKAWSISCLMKVGAGGETFYFKASPDMFAPEARLTRRLSEQFPAHVPGVLAADGERNWLLMRSFHGHILGGRGVAEEWEESVRAFAWIQVEMVPHAAELPGLGCPDRTLPALRDGLERLLADSAQLLVGHEAGVTQEEYAELRGFASAIRGAISDLEACGIPSTLVHGDLHTFNIVVQDGVPVIFDWSDGALAHPFVDFLLVEDRLWQHPETLKDAAPRLKRAYLEPWTTRIPLDTLEPAFDLAQKVAPLYHILSYRWIGDHTEGAAQWELASGMRNFVRILLGKWKG